MTEETKPARRIVWQKDDIRLIAEGNKAVAMERCFKDELGNDMWRDSPNWHAELLAQALVDCEVLAHLEDYRPTLARIADIEKTTASDIDALEAVDATHNRRLERLEKKVRLLDAHTAGQAVRVASLTDHHASLTATVTNLGEQVLNMEAKVKTLLKKKLKKLRARLAGVEDRLTDLETHPDDDIRVIAYGARD